MSNEALKISEISKLLSDKFEEVFLVAAYEWNKHISVYVNKLDSELNMNSLRLFCIKNIGPATMSSQLEEDIFIDYGELGVLALYQFKLGSWLIISTSKKDYPLLNFEISKYKEHPVEFDLQEIKEKEVEKIEENFKKENVILSNTKEPAHIDERMLAAQRLQLSILPDLKVFDGFFNNHFTFFSPEDVLSGDFYWVKQTADTIYVILADCTGHSVEGAMATMTVSAILNRTIFDDPEDSIRQVYFGLDKSGNKQATGYSVGVELALLKYHKPTKQIEIVTSGVPVLFMEDHEKHHLVRSKGTKDPDVKNVSLEKASFQVKSGQRLILYTDGLADQFDKNDKKKLGNAGVKKIFSSMNGNFSATAFERSFVGWKGNTSQLDDITVIALEF